MLLPGVYSVMVPSPSVVVVVVVVCDTCAHANGAAKPNAMHKIAFFIFLFLLLLLLFKFVFNRPGGRSYKRSRLSTREILQGRLL